MNLFVTGIDLCHAATILFWERGYLIPSHELTCTGLSSWGQMERFWSLGTEYGRHHYQHHCRLSQSLLWLTHLRVSFHDAQSSIDHEQHIANKPLAYPSFPSSPIWFDFTCFIEIFIVFFFFLLQNWVKCTLTREHLASNILGQFYAHTHKHDFRLQILNSTDAGKDEKSSKSFALQTASVSPVYANNPAFKVFKLNTMKKAVLDYDQFYLDLVVATGMLTSRQKIALLII